MLLRRYTFKLYPNSAQVIALTEQARMCASLWNALLEMRETHYRRAKQRGDKKTALTAFDQGRDITALRSELPEWRAMPRGTQERVCGDLDLAFKAFFRRAKAGAGAQSGYPRFKSVVRADAIPLREPVKSCWTFEDSAHSGPARKSEPNGGAESSRARGEEGPQNGGSSSRAWRLRMRGIPGAIKARGRFPAKPASFKTADIMFRDGAWWVSICVTFEAARISGGTEKLTIKLNLIDEFASVEDANGRCAPGLTNPFSTAREGEFSTHSNRLAETSCADPAFVGEAQVVEVAPITIDSINSQTDRRFKKFSIRWKRGRARAARISAENARRRREALHRWTSAIVRMASDLTVIAPAIKDAIRSGRGNAQFPGAQVETIAALNRRVMEQAPAAAIAMLAYKAEEAGVRCDIIRDADHEITIGRAIRSAAITGRKISRKIRTAKGS